MLAGNYNFTIEQGAHFERIVTIKNPDGTLYNLTGFSARMQIRTEIDSEEYLIELTTGNGKIALGGASGTITLVLLASETEILQTDGVYDIEIIDGANRVYRVLKGKIRLELEVTR